MLPVINKDGNDKIIMEELIDHIRFMQKRYIMQDVNRTLTNLIGNETADINVTWAEYRKKVYGPGGLLLNLLCLSTYLIEPSNSI